ncbi:MAG: SMC-Scp complex subunit ScpB [Pseudomonadota bacterium]
MDDLSEEARRDFEGLDAREAQSALADELAEDLAGSAAENATDQSAIDAASGDGDGADAPDGDEPASAAVDHNDVDLDDEDDAAGSDEERSSGDGDDAAADDATSGAAPADPVWNAAQEAEHLRMVEALLFAASEPLDAAAIAKRLPPGVDVPSLLEVLVAHYENRGVNLVKIAKKWRFSTNPEIAHVLEIERVEPRKLSRAALETLAIIAYHQPCTRADIEDVRGVAVSKGSLDQLLEVGWVQLRGRRRDAPGRPVLYGTTAAFLEHFGLDTVADLPGAADLKAAGLLDARLPPGFVVPTPTDGDDDSGEEEAGDDAEFSQDFMADDGDDGPSAASS